MSKFAKEQSVCQKCASYRAYYRKGLFCFWVERQGLCCKSQEVVEESGTCELWEPYVKTPATIQAIDHALKDVEVLCRIYEKDDQR